MATTSSSSGGLGEGIGNLVRRRRVLFEASILYRLVEAQPKTQICSFSMKVGILGNAVDFHDSDLGNSTVSSNKERRKMMIAFDMRCVGFITAKMVLREFMDSSTFLKFKSFLNKGNNPSCLREFLVPILSQNSPSGNIGLQMLDRNWGAGWNLLALLLATKSDKRIRWQQQLAPYRLKCDKEPLNNKSI